MRKRSIASVLVILIAVALYYVPAKSISENGTVTSLTGDLCRTYLMLDPNGSLVGWGDDHYGIVKNESPSLSVYPYVLRRVILKDIQYIDSNFNDFALALDREGLLWGLGRNTLLSGGAKRDSETDAFKIMDHVVSAGVGISHAVAVKEDGSLWIWGANDYYSLGQEGEMRFDTPQKIMENVISVSVFDFVTFAVTSEHELYAWGKVFSGTEVLYIKTPTKIASNVQDVISISTILTKDGKYYRWDFDIDSGTISLEEVPTAIKYREGVPKVNEWGLFFAGSFIPHSLSMLNPAKRNCLLLSLAVILVALNVRWKKIDTSK